ncbi:hypothetical protein AGLY_017037 [Aphis glycines]|uniref:Uncharacterized protein n=1 Tax=Aphis glycines TaxID=307491 RepID=A0A6G0SY34_APHGL|nr:hypothetical protein AGLY_017037 [Aphis glycines]
MAKRKLSDIWSYFTRSTDKKLAKCCKCKKEYRKSATYFKRQNVYEHASYCKIEIDKLLLLMICKDFQPFSIVEDIGFKNLVKVLDPRYELPNTLFNIIQNVSHVSLTCDLWSSRANESFLTVTCDFVDENFKMHCFLLSTNKMEINHTSENIAAEMNIIMKDWNIANKNITIVTGNASLMIKACQLLKIRHHYCFAHTLNLMVQDSLKHKEIDCVIKKISNIATHKLITEQENRNKKPLTVIQEVPTR